MPSPSPPSQEKPRFNPQSSRLMGHVREVLRYHHYTIRTEEAYVRWILAFFIPLALTRNKRKYVVPVET